MDIHEDSQTFLGFCWKGVYYVFTVLPFGLASACYVFTKLLRPLVKHLRSQGIRMVLYLDDGIVVVSGFNKALTVSNRVRSILLGAGLVVNQEKSNFAPSKQGSWLSFDIDLHDGAIPFLGQK